LSLTLYTRLFPLRPCHTSPSATSGPNSTRKSGQKPREFEALPENRIAVSATLDIPHPLLAGNRNIGIRDKRKAFEKLIRDRLVEAQAIHDQELENVRADFAAAAIGLLTPIVLEAEAAQRLPQLRKQLLEQSLHLTKTAIRQLNAYLKRDANPLRRQ